MNYFAFFGLPEQLNIDQARLKTTFYENSKKFHPDFYTLASSEEQLSALENSTYNNEGYKVLQNFDSRLKYFLEINNQLAEEGQNQIPQDFLMEMMDFNEQLMELEFDFDAEVHQTAAFWREVEVKVLDGFNWVLVEAADCPAVWLDWDTTVLFEAVTVYVGRRRDRFEFKAIDCR